MIKIKSLLHKDLLMQHYQPIVELSTNGLYSYESLMRCKLKYNPDTLFRAAMRQELLYEMDIFCISKSILSYFIRRDPRNELTLFVNVFPSTLLNPAFIPALERLMDKMDDIQPNSIVFEINEAQEEAQVWEVAALKQIITSLRQNGFRIAVDDVGDGAAGLRKIIEFVPDFIKMSRYFSTDLSVDERKQRIIKLLVDYCGGETRMVLEGIETLEDLMCAKSLGVALGQGYYLGRPKELGNHG
jgi:EAL domain-containing protein (putative c-di-GMP-specific phosphodiesterase class I)